MKQLLFRSLNVLLFIIVFSVNVFADNCVDVKSDLTMNISCASYENILFQCLLTPYLPTEDENLNGFFWTASSFVFNDAGSVCEDPLIINSDLLLTIECAEYYGTHYTFNLTPVESESQLLWTMDMTSFQPVNGPLETARDDKGVWFITGDRTSNLYDIFEAMGYSVATDRLWQAEKYRRIARGRLAEIFGESQLSSDIQVRTTGYSDEEYQQGFEALDLESKNAVNGYVAGFNRRISEIKADKTLLPFEFIAVGTSLGIDFVPEDWTPVDVLAWATTMLRFFDGEGAHQGQIDNLSLFQELSVNFPENYQQMFQDLRWLDDPDAVTYIAEDKALDEPSSIALSRDNLLPSIKHAQNNRLLPDTFSFFDPTCDFQSIAEELRETREKIAANLKEINAYVRMGSYAWVVSGEKTASGNPILYSGPQMDHAFDFSVPSIVTEGSINAGGLNISGMTIPGMPAIVIGRTPHHAWSMQVGHAHTVDYFIEDVSSLSLHRMETIKVAGGEDYQLPVFRTSHGPVINSDPVISWKYSHWGKEFDIIKVYLDMARASSMDEFGDAIDRVSLSQHYCYADSDGNIAYWMSGFDPVRAEGVDPRFPQQGDGTEEWPEPVTYKPRSTDRNSDRGFYSGWNSRSSLAYPNSSNNPSYYFGPFHRAHILEDYLLNHNDLTFEDVRDLALYIATTDSVSSEFMTSDFNTYGDGGNPWKYVQADFTEAVQKDATEARTGALELLAEWDGHFVEGGEENWPAGTDRSDAWILMNQWISEVIKLTFEDELGTGESRIVLFNTLLHGLEGTGSTITNLYDWFSNKTDETQPQTADEIIVAGLDNALTSLGERPWGTDMRGTISYTHEILGVLHEMPTSSRSTYGHCVEMGPSGPVRIESMLPLGESGTVLMGEGGLPVFDPNFFSMSEVYDGFEHRSFPLNN